MNKYTYGCFCIEVENGHHRNVPKPATSLQKKRNKQMNNRPPKGNRAEKQNHVKEVGHVEK